MSHNDGGAWFPTLDHAIGGTADAVGGAVTWPFELVGEATADVAGPVFGGIGDWILKVAVVVAAAAVAIKVL